MREIVRGGVGQRLEKGDERTKAAWTRAYALIDSIMRPLSCVDERAPRAAATGGTGA